MEFSWESCFNRYLMRWLSSTSRKLFIRANFLTSTCFSKQPSFENISSYELQLNTRFSRLQSTSSKPTGKPAAKSSCQTSSCRSLPNRCCGKLPCKINMMSFLLNATSSKLVKICQIIKWSNYYEEKIKWIRLTNLKS